MISLEKLSLLTEDELGMLLHIVNKIFPSLPEVDINLLRSYKRDHLEGKLKSARPAIKEEFLSIYDGLLSKLDIK